MAAKSASAAQARKTGAPKSKINEGELTKGQLRKLKALRKSIGEEIAHKAFSNWLNFQSETVDEVDKDAELIADVLVDRINQGKLRIPRGGYLVRRGKGRVIVERAAE